MIFWRTCMCTWIRNFSCILFLMNDSLIINSRVFEAFISFSVHFLFLKYSWIELMNTSSCKHEIFMNKSWTQHRDRGLLKTLWATMQHFVLFKHCVLPFPNKISIFHAYLCCRPCNWFQFRPALRFCCSVKG